MGYRKKLQKYQGQRVEFIAYFEEYSIINKGMGLLKNVTINGEVVTDHVWVDMSRIHILPGIYTFSGTVKPYVTKRDDKTEIDLSFVAVELCE